MLPRRSWTYRIQFHSNLSVGSVCILAMLRKIGDHYQHVDICNMVLFINSKAFKHIEDGAVKVQEFEVK
jgi:hypothetical protein